MNRMSRLIGLLSLVAVLAVVGPAQAETVIASNGVVIAEQSQVTSGDPVQNFSFTHNGEVMEIAKTRGVNYLKTVIDGSLSLEYFYKINASGERVLDYSVFSYGGSSITRYGSQLTSPGGPCVPNEGCPDPVLHPAAEAQIALVGSALSNLHSAGFLSSIEAANDEIQTMGIGGCMRAIAKYAAAVVVMYYGCAEVLPCLAAIAYLVDAGIDVACACSNYAADPCL